jgi:AcrR family transcriptional regulator
MKDTRTAIVESAFRLFIERGYEGASMADLVAATGLSKGAVYHHFKGKDALHDAAIGHFFLRFFGDDAQPPAADAGLGAVLDGLCAGYVHLMDTVSTVVPDRTAYYRFVFSILPKVKDHIGSQIAETRKRLIAAAELDQKRGTLSTLLPPEAIADHCLALIEGTALLCVVEGRPDIAAALEQSVESYRRLLEQG